MSAYIVIQIQVQDPATYDEYRVAATPTVGLYGGKYLVRGGRVETLEGAWQPSRFVILEFPSVERAKAWHASPEYQSIAPLRYRSATSEMIVAEGTA
ncbi:MAG: DUF1330 domain-containing protein [Chloroflexi bacterium]|nr:MAG: DUF1330 domain-containing protein [Chloroflexota bacterium]